MTTTTSAPTMRAPTGRSILGIAVAIAVGLLVLGGLAGAAIHDGLANGTATLSPLRTAPMYADARTSPNLKDSQRAYVVKLNATTDKVAKGATTTDYAVAASAKFKDDGGSDEVTFTVTGPSEKPAVIVGVIAWVPSSDNTKAGALKGVPYAVSAPRDTVVLRDGNFPKGVKFQVITDDPPKP